MKIAVGSLTYPLANGVTTSINTSVDGFVAAGHQMIVIAPEYPLGKVRPEHEPIPSSVLGKRLTAIFGKEERMFSWRASRRIKKTISSFQPDAFWLHTLTWAPSAFERVMLKSNQPSVLTYHTLVEEYGRIYAGAIGAEVMRRRSVHVGNEVDWVISPSNVIRDKLQHYGIETPISVIPTGVKLPESGFAKADLAQRFNFSPTETLLLMVGRVSVEKNISALLRVVRSLCEDGARYRLLIIGPGDIDELRDEAVKMGIDHQVTFTGSLPKDDVLKAYFGADAFVFASQTETQGLVINEAMFAKTPVIALDSPIRPEVYPEQVAVVVRHEDQFAGSVKALLADEKRRRFLVDKAYRFVQEHFSVESMIERQIEVFHLALEARTKRTGVR